MGMSHNKQNRGEKRGLCGKRGRKLLVILQSVKETQNAIYNRLPLANTEPQTSATGTGQTKLLSLRIRRTICRKDLSGGEVRGRIRNIHPVYYAVTDKFSRPSLKKNFDCGKLELHAGKFF